jgi:hypothetical protein
MAMFKMSSSAATLDDIFNYLFDIFFGEGFVNPEFYRRSVENIYQVPYFYYSQTTERGALPENNAMPLSIEAVAWCYRIFLQREPEGIESIIDHLTKFENRNQTFAKFLFSPEFSTTQIRHLKTAFPDAKRFLLIHIPKTAGTSLREWVFSKAANCVCVHDMKDINRRIVSDFERAKERLVISGHMPWPIWMVSPQDKVYSVLREPVARAISFFKYLGILAIHPDPREIAFFEHLLGLSFSEMMRTTTWLPPSEQCHYLSSEGTFQAVIASTKAFDLSICTISNVATLARKIAGELGFEYTELPRYNHTDEIEFPNYSLDELASFLENHKEDFLLYSYMNALEARSIEAAQADIRPESIAAEQDDEEFETAPESEVGPLLN